MKKTLLFMLLSVAQLLCIGSVKTKDRLSNISGVVVDADTKEPLRGIYVTTGKQGDQTDIKGRFTITSVPQGELSVHTMYSFPYAMTTQKLNLKADTTLMFALTGEILRGDEVVVTGTRTERRLSDTPVLTTVITSNDIQKSGATSILEALQDNIPGIVATPSSRGNNMRIKGLNSRYILILVDGERMVSEGAGGNVNFDQIDVDNIKKIEMINGAASALYGANAVGAVINIITKEPTNKFEAGANVVGESHNTLRTQISAGTNFKKISSRVSAFRKSSDGYGGDGEPYAARYEDWGANLKLGYKPAERVDVNLIGRFFQHETFNPKDDSKKTTHPMSRTVSVGLNSGYISEDKRNNVRLSVNYDKYFDYDVLETKSDELDKSSTASYLSTRLVNTFSPTERWNLVGGVEYNHEGAFSTTMFGWDDDLKEPIPTTKTIDDMNVFVQSEYELFKNFDAIVGARYTYNTQFKSAFTPKISLMYSVAGFKFRGGVGTAFRAPSIKELYYDLNHTGRFWLHGNPDLKAEKGLYTSLSAEYTNGAFNASVSGYYNDIKNKITLYDVITSGVTDKYYKNVSSATLKGFDVNVSYTFFRELVVMGNYSFCDAKDNSTGLQLEDNVKHSGTVSTTWNGKIRRSPFSVQFAGRMNSPILYQSRTINGDGSTTDEITESDPYSIWKVILVKPIRINKHMLELTFKCDNIFDFKETSFNNPGRQYLVGIRYAFK